mgnify:CR=1 FL=1|jgi:solute carrier family 25 (mitochondrial aspartate/glutamate transporter), member 12/13
MNEYNRYISGGLSGVIEVLFTHPLDFLKTKKQEYVQRGINNNFYESIMKEKNLNLYRGVIPRIYGVAPMRLTFWGIQDSTTCFLNKNKINGYQNEIISGTIAGSCQTVLDNPIEILKIQQMSGEKINFSEIFKNYGFKPTLIRNVGFAICMTTIGMHNKSESDFRNFSICATAGAIGSVLTQPIDYVKTKIQRTRKQLSIYQVLSDVIKDDPCKLYTGGLNRMLLGFVSMGVGFVAFDNFSKIICKI